MKSTRTYRWRLWIRPGLVLPAILAGCLCRPAGREGGLVDKCATIPQGAIPQPIGTHTNQLLNRQVDKAEQDQFVIYLYEWQGDTPNFGPFGQIHIERMAARLPQVAHRVIIEPDCDDKINESRRLTVISYLEQHGVADVVPRVQIGYPPAEGLYGEEAPRIFRQMLTPQTNNNRGNFQGSFQGGFGASGGFGAGGGFGGIGGLR
jgi:hypothetical protein